MTVYLILIIGLIAASFASILIKLCDAPAMVIASYRLSLSSIFFITVAGFKKGNPIGVFSRHDFLYASFSGIFLCLHFATWITSLKYTTVANSVVLVSTAPIFVALGSFVFLKEKIARITIVGIFITISGSVIISFVNLGVGENTIIGNALAMTGAVGYAGYILLGRNLRSRMDTLNYVLVVYVTSAILLVLITAFLDLSFFGYNLKIYSLLILIAFVPQVIGHTSFNWALKFISATLVAVVTLGEPIGAIILAFFILGEKLTAIQAIGGIFILIGIMLAIRGESKKHIGSV